MERGVKMTVCKKCGSRYTGNFCSNCGTPSKPQHDDIFSAMNPAEDIEGTIGFISTIMKIISGPVQNTLKIASLESFSHKGFLLKCIAFSAAIGVLSKVQTTNNVVAAILSTTGIFLMVVVQIYLTYYGLRFFSKIYRSGAEYAKMICIAQGFAFLLMGIGEGAGLMFGPVAYLAAMVIQLIILIPYWGMTLGRFWRLNPVLAYIVYLLSMLPAAIVVIIVLQIIGGSIHF
jgi:hypothetical protein